MGKTLKRAVALLLLIAASLLCAYGYTRIKQSVMLKRYPKPESISSYVGQYSNEFGVPENIVYAVIKVESNFRSDAVSRAGAVGLMQIMPVTFEWVCTKIDVYRDPAILYDPETNIRCGVYVLSFLKNKYGDWDTVFAAYNAGTGRVDKWLEDESCLDKDGKLAKPPLAETSAYMKKVADARNVYDEIYK